LKQGGGENELTNYRYDVVLRVGGEKKGREEEGKREERKRVRWEEGEKVREVIERAGEELEVRGIENGRVGRAVAAWGLVERSEGTRTVEEMVRELEEKEIGGERPEEFVRVGEELGYEVKLEWMEGEPGQFAVRLQRAAEEEGKAGAEVERSTWDAGDVEREVAEAGRYANDPSRGSLLQAFAGRLSESLRQRLPDYMLPSAIVMLDAMPLTVNGKIDRERLPDSESRPDVAEYCAPRTPVEEALADIFIQVLKLDRVGVNDNFFQLGGHSLLATRVVVQVREALSVELPLRALFEHPTVAQLAAFIVQEIVAKETPADLDSALADVINIRKPDSESSGPAFAAR
jgi:acyl carrier protein